MVCNAIIPYTFTYIRSALRTRHNTRQYIQTHTRTHRHIQAHRQCRRQNFEDEDMANLYESMATWHTHNTHSPLEGAHTYTQQRRRCSSDSSQEIGSEIPCRPCLNGASLALHVLSIVRAHTNTLLHVYCSHTHRVLPFILCRWLWIEVNRIIY